MKVKFELNVTEYIQEQLQGGSGVLRIQSSIFSKLFILDVLLKST